MGGPDWVLALLISIMVAALVLGLVGLIVLFWFVRRSRAAWWRWPALAAITWLLLGAGIWLGLLIAEAIGVETRDASDDAFVWSLVVLGLAFLPILGWRVWRHEASWWRGPALVGIAAWFLLSFGVLAQHMIAQLI